MGEKYTCKDCKYYKPIDETKGDCFGHEVPADMPVEQCPAKAFEPREENWKFERLLKLWKISFENAKELEYSNN